MRIKEVEIIREDSLIQVENWPQADVVAVESEIVHEDNVVALDAGPVCKDGVCQLGSWKPRKTA